MIRLQRILDLKGISKKDCAVLLGISERTLYNKMTFASEFTLKEAQKLKSFLPEYDIDYILEDENAKCESAS